MEEKQTHCDICHMELQMRFLNLEGGRVATLVCPVHGSRGVKQNNESETKS